MSEGPSHGSASSDKRTSPAPLRSFGQSLSQAPNALGTAASKRSRRVGRRELPIPGTSRNYLSDTPLNRGGALMGTSQAMFDGNNDGDDEDDMIVGTDIKTGDVRDRFHNFLDDFELDQDMDLEQLGESDTYYLKLLRETVSCSRTIYFCIDMCHICSCDVILYGYIVEWPNQVIPLLDEELTMIAEMDLQVDAPQPVKFTPFNMHGVITIHELDPSDMNKLISVEGMITRTSSIAPQIKVASLQCQQCKHIKEVSTDINQVEEPQLCENCKEKWLFSMEDIWSSFGSRQVITMQESPNHIPEGATPHTISINAQDAMVDKCKPGDRVRIIGVYCEDMKLLDLVNCSVDCVSKPYIDLLHVNIIKQIGDDLHLSLEKREKSPDQNEEIDNDHEAALPIGLTQTDTIAEDIEMQILTNYSKIYQNLVASLAPSVQKMEKSKREILSQLFCDSEPITSEDSVRNGIKILFVGDPGVSKSHLLTYVHKLRTGELNDSDKGSSVVGVTAFITKDPESKEIILESGALVLSDRRICCIDEFDKMSQIPRSTLHEVMEQQSISVQETGIVSTLNARVSILASANPCGCKYDMIFLALDMPDELRDTR